ncbi:hypothetical protein [Bremerella sp.]|uniref:hypothetical protein n=1 Tax=Bremerella sp. TaxID=2795602 RepID=UPI0039194BE0
MSQPHKLSGRSLPIPARFATWWIGCFDVKREELLEVLGEPHFEEHDSLRTAGGSEDHWAFEFADGMKVGVLFRRPYDQADIFADSSDVQAALAWLEPLLKDREVKTGDGPVSVL